ncbi:MAG: DUF4926 domain-containing protein [Candidatus Desantisbacteria bacterium]
MIQELEFVALVHDIEKYGLKQGDIGTVVHCYKDELACEVEFITAFGETIAVETLSFDEVRPLKGMEILHVREMKMAA